MSLFPWPELKAGGPPLIALIAILVVVAVVRFRSPGRWLDALLWVAVAATLTLLALVMLG